MILDQDIQWTNCQCDRCGVKYTISSRRPGKSDYCSSCIAKPTERITYSGAYCIAWHGQFDEQDNPVKNNQLYRPGVRTCGHRDCVRVSHIEPDVKPKLETVFKHSFAEMQTVVDAQPKYLHGMTICQLPGCDIKHLCKGLCSKHYASWLRQTKKKATA